MERALNIREIVEMVIGHADRKSMVACARVCRFLSDVALDDIWHTLREPGHLFMLLTRTKGTSTKYREWYKEIDLDDLDWIRLASYSRRVKVFDFGIDAFDEAQLMIETRELAKLVHLCPLARIFPRLERLIMDVKTDTTGSIAYVARLCAESTIECTLFLSVSSHEAPRLEARTLVQGIILNSPYITEFGLYPFRCGSIKGSELEKCFVELISRLRRLRKVSLGESSFSAPFLHVVARLPQLSVLELEGENDEFTVESLQGTAHSSEVFASLTSLSFSATQSQLVSLFCKHQCFAQLREVSLNLRHCIEEEELQAVFAAIAGTCHDLEELHIHQYSLEIDRSNHRALSHKNFTGAVMRPLKELKKLSEFTFSNMNANDVSDTDILQLVKDCPALEVLRVFTSRTSSTDVTPNVLSLLSHQQNRLRSLELCVHFGASTFLSEGDIGVHLKGLTELDFGYSTIDLEASDEANVKRLGSFIKKCVSEHCKRSEDPHAFPDGEAELKWGEVWAVVTDAV